MPGLGYDFDKASSHSHEGAEILLGKFCGEVRERSAGPSVGNPIRRNLEEDGEEPFTIPETGVAP